MSTWRKGSPEEGLNRAETTPEASGHAPICRSSLQANDAMNPQPEPTASHSSEDTAHLNLSKLVASRDSVLPSVAGKSVTALVARATAEVARQGGVPRVQPKNSGGVPEGKMPGDVPSPEAIRRFRRLDRQVIQSTLEKVLRYTRKKLRSFVAPENPFRSGSSAAAMSPVEETQMFARRDASDRLDKATFSDGMSM